MSYKQIIRRANRILRSTVNDWIDQFTKEEQELADFDEQLRQSTQRRSSQSSSERRTQGGTHRGHSSQGDGSRQTRTEGKRKPGEKDDAFYFAVLGLTPSANMDEIKRAYKNLMRKYHPDAVASLTPREQAAASEKAKSINEAYHIIERRRGFK